MNISHTAARTRRRRKVMAITSAGVAVGLAAVVTLASWNDQEWVFGGSGPGGTSQPGVGTSTFNVQQDAWDATSPAAQSATFDDNETNPGNPLIFNVEPNGLTPGDTIYAPVAMTTEANSIAGNLTLQAPVADVGKTATDAGGLLWDNLTYTVRVTDVQATADNCRTDFANAGTAIVTNQPFTAGATVAQSLSAAGTNVQYYCFAITLPDNATTQGLPGRTVFPAWQFAAVSS